MSDGPTWLLLYTYVPDILDRRGPHRAGHLGAINAERDAGRLLLAGGIGDPIGGGALVFQGVDRDHVSNFVARDPYVEAGLVSDWRIEPWNLV
jgi:uncharacterized protein